MLADVPRKPPWDNLMWFTIIRFKKYAFTHFLCLFAPGIKAEGVGKTWVQYEWHPKSVTMCLLEQRHSKILKGCFFHECWQREREWPWFMSASHPSPARAATPVASWDPSRGGLARTSWKEKEKKAWSNILRCNRSSGTAFPLQICLNHSLLRQSP